MIQIKAKEEVYFRGDKFIHATAVFLGGKGV